MTDSEQLGVDLYKLWFAGHSQLPDAGGALRSAFMTTPSGISGLCARGGGLGSGPQGPGPAIDSLLASLNNILLQGSIALDDTGEALVWLANEYAKTDAHAARTLKNYEQTVKDH